MAANLVKAGFDAAVCDDMPGHSGRCASEVGGQAAADAAAAHKSADAVVAILPTSNQEAAVAAQIAPVLTAGALVIDRPTASMTRGQPAKMRKIAAKLAKCGATMIDAPAFGGMPRAKSGDLAIMVGGEKT
jgi:3-hydroxyisobutyrate dehydrogenase